MKYKSFRCIKKLKKFFKKIKLYFTLPHLVFLVIISIVSIISLILSILMKSAYPYFSSMLASLFSGLLTGVVICLFSTIKSVILYRNNHKIKVLEEMHTDCLNYMNEYHNLLNKPNEFYDSTEGENKIYDVLCMGNDINDKILIETKYNNLPFNLKKFCKKEFQYDAEKYVEINLNLRDKIINDFSNGFSYEDIVSSFKDMNNRINELNYSIINKINDLKAKEKAINNSII